MRRISLSPSRVCFDLFSAPSDSRWVLQDGYLPAVCLDRARERNKVRLLCRHEDVFQVDRFVLGDASANAIAVRGYTWSSIEFMGAFNTLRTRGVTVVDSLHPPGIGFDIAMLILLNSVFRVRPNLFCQRAISGKWWRVVSVLEFVQASMHQEGSKRPRGKSSRRGN